MMTPAVHLNGTSRAELFAGYLAAGQAVREAMTALAGAAPNGRDYYVKSATAFTEAAAEHRSRMARLQSVYDELEQLAEAVAD